MFDFENADKELVAGTRKFDRDFAQEYSKDILSHPVYSELAEIKHFSMLGTETLIMARAFAMETKGAIVEIGPYIGGSTVAMGHGVKASSKKQIISIDPGGAYLDQPHLPSADIHADWNKNVTANDMNDITTLIKGSSYQDVIANETIARLNGEKIGILFIDADGRLFQNFIKLIPHLADDCLLIFDDYTNLYDGVDYGKNCMVKPVVDLAAQIGAFDEYCILMWGTWFGRIGKKFKEKWQELLDYEISIRN